MDPERRFHLRSELAAASFDLCGIARDGFEYIMGTFLIVRSKGEKE